MGVFKGVQLVEECLDFVHPRLNTTLDKLFVTYRCTKVYETCVSDGFNAEA